MEGALETEESPLDAKLESILPGLHQWHTANNAAISKLQANIEALDNKVDTTANAIVNQVDGQSDTMIIAMQSALKLMLKRKRGAITTVSSPGKQRSEGDEFADFFSSDDEENSPPRKRVAKNGKY
jgi:hypothetical protein